MLDRILREIRGQADAWRREVERRRAVTPVDPVADTMAHLAGQLDRLVEDLEARTQELAPEDFARLHHTTPQTVTAWIRRGKIPARRKGRGWLVPRDAAPPRPRERLRKAS